MQHPERLSNNAGPGVPGIWRRIRRPTGRGRPGHPRRPRTILGHDLFRAHAVRLVRVAVLLLGDQPSAEDAGQDRVPPAVPRPPSLRDHDKALPYLASFGHQRVLVAAAGAQAGAAAAVPARAGAIWPCPSRPRWTAGPPRRADRAVRPGCRSPLPDVRPGAGLPRTWAGRPRSRRSGSAGARCHPAGPAREPLLARMPKDAAVNAVRGQAARCLPRRRRDGPARPVPVAGVRGLHAGELGLARPARRRRLAGRPGCDPGRGGRRRHRGGVAVSVLGLHRLLRGPCRGGPAAGPVLRNAGLPRRLNWRRTRPWS